MFMDSSSDGDIGFAFNEARFSDHLLRIKITRGGCGEVSCLSKVNRKRRRVYLQNQTGEHENEYNRSDLRVKELHISAPILASKSTFFYKLFSNETLDSEANHLTLKIDASEEAAVMELLKFMYTNSLSAMEVPALLDVLKAANKFEVPSCMKYCSRLLLSMPMTLDLASHLLGLPSTLLRADPIQPLTNVAKQFLTLRYKNITKLNLEEVMTLPLVGMKAILASNDLMIRSEDIVYDIALRWTKKHYSVVEERHEILGSHLARYIRFPQMTCSKLRKILASDDLKPSIASSLVLEALFFKAEPLSHQRVLAAGKNASSLNNRLVERAYIDRPIKIVEFEVPRRQCIAYLDLTRKECDALYPVGRIQSQLFDFGGQGFVLSAYCKMAPPNLFHGFGLFLGMKEKGSASLTADYEFSARSKPTEDFDVKYKGNLKFEAGKSVGYINFFRTSWDSFIAKDCPYFINDVLHLRVKLSIPL